MKTALQNKLSLIFTGLKNKLIGNSKLILSVFLIGISMVLSVKSVACPPPCTSCWINWPDCDVWKCEGCESCEGSSCVDKDSNCGNPDCWNCNSGNCNCDITINSISSDDIVCVGEDLMFTASVTGSCSCVDWSAQGNVDTASGTCSFTTSWDTAGEYTVTAKSDCGSSITKNIIVIDGLTVVPRKAYVCFGCNKDFEAWACVNGVHTNVTSSSTFTTSNGSFNGNRLTPSSVSMSEGADWVRATYDGNTTDADHDCDLTVVGVTITAIDRIPPTKTESVSITVSPSITGGSVDLDVIATTGSGSATVSPTSITSNSSVTVTGGSQSSEKDNLKLRAIVDSCVCEDEDFTVCAHPIDPEITYCNALVASKHYGIQILYEWDSDGGLDSQLDKCDLKEFFPTGFGNTPPFYDFDLPTPVTRTMESGGTPDTQGYLKTAVRNYTYATAAWSQYLYFECRRCNADGAISDNTTTFTVHQDSVWKIKTEVTYTCSGPAYPCDNDEWLDNE